MNDEANASAKACANDVRKILVVLNEDRISLSSYRLLEVIKISYGFRNIAVFDNNRIALEFLKQNNQRNALGARYRAIIAVYSDGLTDERPIWDSFRSVEGVLLILAIPFHLGDAGIFPLGQDAEIDISLQNPTPNLDCKLRKIIGLPASNHQPPEVLCENHDNETLSAELVG